MGNFIRTRFGRFTPRAIVELVWEDAMSDNTMTSAEEVFTAKPCIRKNYGILLRCDDNLTVIAHTDDSNAKTSGDVSDVLFVPTSIVRKISLLTPKGRGTK